MRAIGAMILLLAALTSARAAAPTATTLTAISLQRTACFGTCPEDTVTLHPDGSADYTGERYVPQIGAYRGTFPASSFQRLARLLQASGFFNMKPAYRRPISDLPAVITTAIRGGASKQVLNYGDAGPEALWVIQEAILGVSSQITWEAAPTGSAPGAAPAARSSGIRGVALAGPVSPVSRPGQPDTAPLPGAVITLQPAAGGAELGRTQADDAGRFTVPAVPGRYLLVPLPPTPKATLPRGVPQQVLVRAGRMTQVTVEYDTGIR